MVTGTQCNLPLHKGIDECQYCQSLSFTHSPLSLSLLPSLGLYLSLSFPPPPLSLPLLPSFSLFPLTSSKTGSHVSLGPIASALPVSSPAVFTLT